ncbi:DUF1351 domain-containing protein [Leuconostoc mesenteroides]|uniref:DUF1351 domain-containing protein n=1 Tax=Leuconostoc mesenteroides TaxID=1245 RepID=UPI000FFCD1FD|nr:DUF1351 domain-containing protein [Leuconostoc mesenteroides]QAR69687.1 DUF1351 domain-containing protein [Leuconostoc mesenteroides]WJM73580.1 DUF1351 domain-containing protein [Leuconostoc mesenteroides]
MNELTQPQVGFKDGQIQFENVDQFKKDFEQIIKRHSNFIVTEDTMKGAKASRADLRNAAKESASWRSKVKAELLKPFDDISEIATEYEKKAKDAADEIDKDIKVFEEVEKQKRRDGLNDFIVQRADDLDVNPDLEINDKWFIKGNFNGTVPKKAFLEEHIEPQFELLVKNKEQRVANTVAIRNYAESKTFDPEGYIHNLDSKSLAEIMSDIDHDVVKRQKREEAAKAVAEMETEKRLENHIDEVTVDNRVIDQNTGEIVSEAPQITVTSANLNTVNQVSASPEIDLKSQQTFTRLLYVTGTIEDLNAVATFLNANAIEFRGES